MNKQAAFAEVIESSLQMFTAQTWEWDNLPRFGSVMAIETAECILFGVVYEVKTGPLDGHRQPFAYQKTEEELKREQPQIFEFLITTFSCLILGYQARNSHAITYQWASKPPKIHSFVALAQEQELQRLFAQDSYLHLIFNAHTLIQNSDELLLALLKEQFDAGFLSKTRLHEMLEAFSLLSNNDYRRLKLLLQRASFLQNIN